MEWIGFQTIHGQLVYLTSGYMVFSRHNFTMLRVLLLCSSLAHKLNMCTSHHSSNPSCHVGSAAWHAGVLTWQVCTAETPWVSAPQENGPPVMKPNPKLPSLPQGWPPELQRLVLHCLQRNPKARPGMSHVVYELKSLVGRMEPGFLSTKDYKQFKQQGQEQRRQQNQQKQQKQAGREAGSEPSPGDLVSAPETACAGLGEADTLAQPVTAATAVAAAADAGGERSLSRVIKTLMRSQADSTAHLATSLFSNGGAVASPPPAGQQEALVLTLNLEGDGGSQAGGV